MKDLAVDACCLINLLAAGAILPPPAVSMGKGMAARRTPSASPLEAILHVPAVVARESLYLLRPDDDQTKLVKSPIDLTPYFAQGVLCECEIEGEVETGLFVQYATILDDGEAACLAIARQRGWTLATDDRPAAALAGRANVPVVSTAQLVKHWAKRANASKQQVAAVLANIRRFAKFVPRPNSPEASWWFSHHRQK